LENKITTISIDDVRELKNDDFDINEFNSFTKINTKIEAVKYKTHYSDVIILNNYFVKGLSMRKIAKKFNIAPSTVLRSLKKTKEKIRIEIEEDYIDYINADYERI
jgi:DNA-directed RNA polymerase specialized sigma subunit